MQLAASGKVHSSETPILTHAQLGDDHLGNKHWMVILTMYASHLHDVDLRETDLVRQADVDAALVSPGIYQRGEGRRRGRGTSRQHRRYERADLNP